MAGDDISELPAEPVTPSRGLGQRGKFRDGTWYCDCSPSLPCLFLTASNSKDKANNGRKFFICQKDKKTKNSCGFFLWADQAHKREVNYVMSNRKSEMVQSQLHFPATQAAGGNGSGNGKRQLKQATLDNMPIRSRSSRRLKAAAAAAAAAVASGSGSGGETASGSSGGEDAMSSKKAMSGSSQKSKRTDSPGASSSHTASTRTLRSSGSQQQQQQRQEKQAELLHGTKRKAPTNDEFSDFSDGEVEELAAIEQRSGGSSWTGSTTRTRDAFATPNVAGGRSIFAAHYRDEDEVANGMPTPSTTRSVRRVLFASDGQNGKDKSSIHHGLNTPPTVGKRQRNTAEGAYTLGTQRHAQTPASVSRSMMSNTTPGTSFSSDPGGSQSGAVNITADVLDILRSQKIAPAVLDDVKGVLDSFSRRTAGYERGRDRSRREIQRQQRRIAELEQRTAALENSRELDRAAFRGLRRMEE